MDNKNNYQELIDMMNKNKDGFDKIQKLSKGLDDINRWKNESYMVIFDSNTDRNNFDKLIVNLNDSSMVDCETKIDDEMVKGLIMSVDSLKYLESNGKHIKYNVKKLNGQPNVTIIT